MLLRHERAGEIGASRSSKSTGSRSGKADAGPGTHGRVEPSAAGIPSKRRPDDDDMVGLTPRPPARDADGGDDGIRRDRPARARGAALATRLSVSARRASLEGEEGGSVPGRRTSRGRDEGDRDEAEQVRPAHEEPDEGTDKTESGVRGNRGEGPPCPTGSRRSWARHCAGWLRDVASSTSGSSIHRRDAFGVHSAGVSTCGRPDPAVHYPY